MKIDINQTLKAMNGQVMKDDDGTGKIVDATLRMAMVNAILSPVERESGMKKVEKYELAKRIHNTKGEMELSAEDISLIKERVGEIFPVLVVGQVFNILEGKE